MTQKISDLILNGSYTQTDALRRLGILKDFVVSKLFNSATPPFTSKNLSNRDMIWLDSLDRDLAQQFNQTHVYEVFEEAEKEITQIKTLTIFIPFEAGAEQIISLGERARSLFGKNFLIEIKFDPNLVAGASLSWQGTIKDYSLRQAIESNRQKILEKMKGYLTTKR